MKAVLFLALVGVVAATGGTAPIGTQYVVSSGVAATNGGVCSPAEGYIFAIFGNKAPIAKVDGTLSVNSKVDPTTTGGVCNFVAAADDDLFAIGCAPGFTSSSCPGNLAGTTWTTAGTEAPTGCYAVGQVLGSGTGFTAADPYNSAGPGDTGAVVDLGSAGTFKCTPVVPNATNTTGCNISCIGKTCAADLPRTVADGTTLTGAQLCISGSFVSSSSIPASGTSDSYVCTGGATNSVAWDVVCSDTPTSTMTASQWFTYAAGQGGFSRPVVCNCAGASTATTFPIVGTYPNQYIVGPCVITGCTATRSGRQNTLAAGVLCPPTFTTPAEIAQCFEAAACAGLVTPLDKCIYGQTSAGIELTTDCPACSESKKGLLGLLGLLGLIPLLLCSLLLCCLLLCIRRKKAEREVHFATFDAGAPNCDLPVVHNTSSVHHNTYVGAPHVGGPVACY